MKIRLLHGNLVKYVLFLIAVLPVFIYRDFTPDNELRYLSIADEAIKNGTYFTFSNHGIPYADKPPLYLWLIMLGKLLLGHHNLVLLGMFSFIPALIVVYIMDQWVKNELYESERLAGQLMLMTSAYFLASSLILRMDMLMTLFITLALHSFYRIYTGTARARDSYLFPVCIFLAIFTKGTLGLIIPLFSTITFLYFSGKIKSAGKYWGLKTVSLLLILAAAWFAAVYREGGGLYLNNLLFNQTIHRAVNSFHHKAPFYYYLASFWYVLAPWSILCAGVLFMGLKKRIVLTDLERFFLITGLSTFIVLSLFSAKLAVYLLPALPFFIYVSLLWLKRLGSPTWSLVLTGIPAFALMMAFPAVHFGKQYLDTNGIGISVVLTFTALLLTTTGFLTLRFLSSGRLTPAIKTMGTGILVAVFSASFAVPQYNSLIGLGELSSYARQIASRNADTKYYYCEMGRGDNLDIYLGVKPEMLSTHDLYETNSPLKKPAIVFLRKKEIQQNDSLRSFIVGKSIHQTGNYCFVEIN